MSGINNMVVGITSFIGTFKLLKYYINKNTSNHINGKK